jgi:hypothetical protein
LRTDVPTVSEVVERAAAICDPGGHEEAVAEMVRRFEDDERPARATDGLRDLTSQATNVADPGADSPAAVMTAVAAAWLATNIEHGDDPNRVLRESARAAFDGRPPEYVEDWLRAQGVEL